MRSEMVACDPARALRGPSFGADQAGSRAPIGGGEHLSAMLTIEHLADFWVQHHASTLRSPVT